MPDDAPSVPNPTSGADRMSLTVEPVRPAAGAAAELICLNCNCGCGCGCGCFLDEDAD